MEEIKKSTIDSTDADKVQNDTITNENSSKKSESLENALRRFKKQSSGIISEIRKREAYDKPSVRRKKKSKEARKHKKMDRYSINKW